MKRKTSYYFRVFLPAPFKIAPAVIARIFKGSTACQFFVKHPELKKKALGWAFMEPKLKAQIHADRKTEATLKGAMFCATKAYNGLLWHLRLERISTAS